MTTFRVMSRDFSVTDWDIVETNDGKLLRNCVERFVKMQMNRLNMGKKFVNEELKKKINVPILEIYEVFETEEYFLTCVYENYVIYMQNALLVHGFCDKNGYTLKKVTKDFTGYVIHDWFNNELRKFWSQWRYRYANWGWSKCCEFIWTFDQYYNYAPSPFSLPFS